MWQEIHEKNRLNEPVVTYAISTGGYPQRNPHLEHLLGRVQTGRALQI